MSNPTPKRARSSKRKVGESSFNPPPPQPPNRLDLWFSIESDKMNYLEFNATKHVASPKYLDLDWFIREFEAQGLRRFLEMKGTFYPDLVKVFYTCAKGSMQGNMVSKVKGVTMEITLEVWESMAGVICEGAKRFDEEPDGYNKMDTYREMLHDPHMQLRNRLGTGPMTPEDGLLPYIITYVVTPRATNHAQATDEDLQLVYGLKNNILMNWVLIFEKIMLKAKRLVNYPFPYPVLVSRLIDHFNINVENEVVDNTNSSNSVIQEKHLNKIGMRKTPDVWIMAGQALAAAVAVEEQVVVDSEDEERNPQQLIYTQFESLMLEKMNGLLNLHHELRVETQSSFRDLNARLDVIEATLKVDDSEEF